MNAAIICGSRDWTDSAAVEDVVQDLDPDTIVIHGAARGADRLAQTHAFRHGLQVVPMPAQWKRDGRGAGPIRNSRMLDVLLRLQLCGYGVEVHAFPLGESRGTRHMMRIAAEAGVRVHDHGRRAT